MLSVKKSSVEDVGDRAGMIGVGRMDVKVRIKLKERSLVQLMNSYVRPSLTPLPLLSSNPLTGLVLQHSPSTFSLIISPYSL